MALIALRKLNLQTRMRSNPLGIHVWYLVKPFVYFHTLCVRTAKALARLRGWTDSPEPSLFAYAIRTIISWAGSVMLQRHWKWFSKSGAEVLKMQEALSNNKRFNDFNDVKRCILMSRLMTKPTNWHVRPAKTQISLGIRPVWSESSVCAFRIA